MRHGMSGVYAHFGASKGTVRNLAFTCWLMTSTLRSAAVEQANTVSWMLLYGQMVVIATHEARAVLESVRLRVARDVGIDEIGLGMDMVPMMDAVITAPELFVPRDSEMEETYGDARDV